MQEPQVWSLGWEDPLEEETSIYSSILAWKNTINREAWQATVHGLTKSQRRLRDGACMHTFQRNTLKETPRIIFDEISGQHDPVKYIHTINDQTFYLFLCFFLSFCQKWVWILSNVLTAYISMIIYPSVDSFNQNIVDLHYISFRYTI